MNLTEHFAVQLLYPERRQAILQPLSSIASLDVTHTVREKDDYLYEHKISAEWKANVFVKREETTAALRNVVRAFNEAAYGHLRQRIMALEMAILEHDRQKALSHLRDLYRETEWTL